MTCCWETFSSVFRVNKMSHEILISAITEFGAQARFRSEACGDWEYVKKHSTFQGVVDSDMNVEYQKSYFQNFSQQDLSLVFYRKNGKPCGLAPLCIREHENECFIASAGLSIEPIQFIMNLSNAEQKRLSKSFLRALISYSSSLGVREFKCNAYSEQFTDAINGWHTSCAELADAVNIQHQAYVDLTEDLETLRVSFRKSYRPLIKKAEKLWESKILGSGEIRQSDWVEFKQLHFMAAGNRQTRSDNSWDVQFSQILEGNAFLIALHDQQRRMVGGGLFTFTKDQGMYSVAAYDRSHFDKPLGHLVQWLAIKEFKRLGMKSYILGDRPYPSDTPTPTDKEINIGLFKEGFATAIRPRFVFCFSPT